ncbi:MAG: hypothetical protein M1426_01845, partial [Patescibacteria group bacterium]|nr:hypothetical protein [Patescibacteria group bacterium]
AKTLDRTITALKNKNQDFFVLNGGLDASAPSVMPEHEEELFFMKGMNEAVPGIFEKLDGWVSHSYPNPEFAGSPSASGRGTVRTYLWELSQLRDLGVNKDLPIFITETGWKHAEGINYLSYLPSAERVADYYQNAFGNAWNTNRIVAVTPFLLNYQEIPFDHFSFKRITGERQSEKILGVENPNPDYYPMYQAIQALQKTAGTPVQENKAELTKGEIFSSVVSGQNYRISLTFKNTGQSIWNDPLSQNQVKLVAVQGAAELGITPVSIPKDTKVEPGQEHTFKINLKAPQSGTFKVILALFNGEKQIDAPGLEFTTVVKSPVILQIKGELQWKEDFAGSYTLAIKGVNGESLQNINLDKNGWSNEIEARFLLPDYTFDFTLDRPYYHPTKIQQKVFTGVNVLDFGKLQPDMLSAVLNPGQFWRLLPFSK